MADNERSFPSSTRPVADTKVQKRLWLVGQLFVQQMAELHYNLAIQDIRNYRILNWKFSTKVTPEVQKIATDMYETDPEAAIDFVSLTMLS